MADDLLRAESDVARAQWIAPRLGELGSLAGTAPNGFEAYVRVCHPADCDGRLYTWPHVARETGRTVHPLMQWHALVGASDDLNMSDSTWPGGNPQRGQSPNLFWPDERAWFMASEIDFDSTVIGGSSELAQALLAKPELDAWPVEAGDLLTASADEINHVSPAT